MDDEAPLLLVVENDNGLRSDYGVWLVDEGYRVLLAANGLEALELTRMHLPNLLLMNLDLPVLDGWEVTRVLRRDPRLCGIRVVAMTGRGTKTPDCDGKSAGCDASLRTPVSRPTLLAVAHRWVPLVPESLTRIKVQRADSGPQTPWSLLRRRV